MIEGFKAIAEALSKASGFVFSIDNVRKAMRRTVDPLPVEQFDGRVGIRPEDLIAWVNRRKGIGSPRGRKPKHAA